MPKRLSGILLCLFMLSQSAPAAAGHAPVGLVIFFNLLAVIDEALEARAEQQAAPPPARRFAAPAPIACAMPPAPPSAAGLYGTVELRYLVDVDGAVIDAEVQKSSGHEQLDAAGLAAIRQCRLPPAVRDGRPVPSWQAVGYTWQRGATD